MIVNSGFLATTTFLRFRLLFLPFMKNRFFNFHPPPPSLLGTPTVPNNIILIRVHKSPKDKINNNFHEKSSEIDLLIITKLLSISNDIRKK